MARYESLDSYKKLSHVGPVGQENFNNSLKIAVTKYEFEQILKMFEKSGFREKGDCLQVCNTANIEPFIETFRKTAQ